ncbi:MAG: Rpn family recombination-promoting nuclease/putative transposase [Saprospiraceae bacterium]|nr:MAG: Rpn family recombination-promoting nuclease/putative transposase [Saprospiraceae bacterium]HMY84738.1 Rpn family recombination-promoting nuclease/putative transposase [Saprospiraceae bacterium]HNH41289.1 Rpn family recombination-promoting nuclease/putative transposase [Saprospiraceae bacterium]
MAKSKSSTPSKSPIPRITHDAFMKKILSDRDAARSFLIGFLPEHIVSFLDIDAFSYQDSVFHNEKMQTRLADMVFDIPVKDSKDAVQVSVLFELKSHKDPFTWLQILEYLAAAYRKQLHQKGKGQGKLKLIIPVIYYHGKEVWKQEKNASFFKDFPESLHSFIPEFDRIFIDLKTLSEKEILSISNSLMKATLRIHLLRLMKQIEEGEFRRVFEEFRTDKYGNYLGSIIVYSLQNLNISSEEMNTFIDEFPEPIKSETMTIAEQLYRKGVKEGKEQGVQEGLEKGMQLGIEKAQFEIIVKSFENGASIDFISNITGLPESKIKEILNLR